MRGVLFGGGLYVGCHTGIQGLCEDFVTACTHQRNEIPIATRVVCGRGCSCLGQNIFSMSGLLDPVFFGRSHTSGRSFRSYRPSTVHPVSAATSCCAGSVYERVRLQPKKRALDHADGTASIRYTIQILPEKSTVDQRVEIGDLSRVCGTLLLFLPKFFLYAARPWVC